jgi:transposase
MDVDDVPINRVMLKDLSFKLVASKFRMPIKEAAKELRVSTSTLQTWCRTNGIPRWPYRKIRSMKILLENVKVTQQQLS